MPHAPHLGPRLRGDDDKMCGYDDKMRAGMTNMRRAGMTDVRRAGMTIRCVRHDEYEACGDDDVRCYNRIDPTVPSTR